METKSRYEVISDLESKKRSLIIEKDGLKDKLKEQETEIRDLKRDLEDAEEELKDSKKRMSEREKVLDELIKSVDESLNRLGKMTHTSSKSQKK